MKKVLIKYLLTPIPPKLNTLDGVKKLNKKGEFKVTESTALELVDNVNFGTDEELDDLKKDLNIGEDVNTEDPDDDAEDTELNEDDTNPGENSELDEETKILVDSLTDMKRKDMNKVAKDCGLDPKDFNNKDELRDKIVAILKGSEEA